MGRAILLRFPGLTPGGPAFLVDLGDPAQGQGPVRHVLSDRRTRADVRPFPDPDGGHDRQASQFEAGIPK